MNSASNATEFSKLKGKNTSSSNCTPKRFWWILAVCSLFLFDWAILILETDVKDEVAVEADPEEEFEEFDEEEEDSDGDAFEAEQADAEAEPVEGRQQIPFGQSKHSIRNYLVHFLKLWST